VVIAAQAKAIEVLLCLPMLSLSRRVPLGVVWTGFCWSVVRHGVGTPCPPAAVSLRDRHVNHLLYERDHQDERDNQDHYFIFYALRFSTARVR
jgi:hypothetical protein